jgi:hypothetical protein
MYQALGFGAFGASLDSMGDCFWCVVRLYIACNNGSDPQYNAADLATAVMHVGDAAYVATGWLAWQGVWANSVQYHGAYMLDIYMELSAIHFEAIACMHEIA